VGDQDHRLAHPAIQLQQEAQHLAAGLEVERAGGLVTEKEPGVRGDGAGDCHALLLAAAELRGEVVGALRQPNQPQRLARVHRLAGHRRGHLHVLERREARHQVEELEDEPNVVPPIEREFPRRGPRQVATIVEDRARSGAIHPPEDIQQGRLARTARPGHDEKLAVEDVYGRRAQGVDVHLPHLVNLADLPRRENRFAHGYSFQAAF